MSPYIAFSCIAAGSIIVCLWLKSRHPPYCNRSDFECTLKTCQFKTQCTGDIRSLKLQISFCQDSRQNTGERPYAHKVVFKVKCIHGCWMKQLTSPHLNITLLASFSTSSANTQFQGGVKDTSVGKNCSFQLKSPFISETVRDRPIKRPPKSAWLWSRDPNSKFWDHPNNF